jgi:hypothetical protein
MAKARVLNFAYCGNSCQINIYFFVFKNKIAPRPHLGWGMLPVVPVWDGGMGHFGGWAGFLH